MPLDIKGGVIAPASRTCKTCGFYNMCRFDQKKNGAFKDHGAKFIGYRMICDKTERHAAKEDFCTCFNFVESIQGRMVNGEIQRAQGKDADIIRIIAQEGEEIERRIRLGFNALGEVVRPQAEIVADLKRAGFKVATSDHTTVVNWRDATYKVKVPSYATFMESVNSYDDLLAKREMEYQNAEADVSETAWAEAKQRMAAEDAAAAPVKAEPVGKR